MNPDNFPVIKKVIPNNDYTFNWPSAGEKNDKTSNIILMFNHKLF